MPGIGDIPRDAVLTNLCDFSGFENARTPKMDQPTVRYTAPTTRQGLDWFVQGRGYMKTNIT